ncbi:MAG: PEP-CTERM sorting domain-containing protein [Lentisphaerae bacterium]|nr:PEP-CTERM sorting domain-containing protein [Lentisphaerota bacterium]
MAVVWLPRPCAGAVLDWDALAWTAGDNDGSSPYNVGPYQAMITVAYVSEPGTVDSSDGSTLYPRLSTWASLGNEKALNVWMNATTDNGSAAYVQIEIALNAAVSGITFTLADIDAGGAWDGQRYANWQDVVVVSAFQDGVRRQITGTDFDPTPSYGRDTDGNDYSSSSLDLSLYGTGSAAESDPSGNIRVRITDPADRVVIRYSPGGMDERRGRQWYRYEDGLPGAGPADPDGQRLVIGDILLPDGVLVPEPSTGVLLTAGALAFATARRRRRSAAA